MLLSDALAAPINTFYEFSPRCLQRAVIYSRESLKASPIASLLARVAFTAIGSAALYFADKIPQPRYRMEVASYTLMGVTFVATALLNITTRAEKFFRRLQERNSDLPINGLVCHVMPKKSEQIDEDSQLPETKLSVNDKTGRVEIRLNEAAIELGGGSVTTVPGAEEESDGFTLVTCDDIDALITMIRSYHESKIEYIQSVLETYSGKHSIEKVNSTLEELEQQLNSTEMYGAFPPIYHGTVTIPDGTCKVVALPIMGNEQEIVEEEEEITSTYTIQKGYLVCIEKEDQEPLMFMTKYPMVKESNRGPFIFKLEDDSEIAPMKRESEFSSASFVAETSLAPFAKVGETSPFIMTKEVTDKIALKLLYGISTGSWKIRLCDNSKDSDPARTISLTGNDYTFGNVDKQRINLRAETSKDGSGSKRLNPCQQWTRWVVAQLTPDRLQLKNN